MTVTISNRYDKDKRKSPRLLAECVIPHLKVELAGNDDVFDSYSRGFSIIGIDESGLVILLFTSNDPPRMTLFSSPRRTSFPFSSSRAFPPSFFFIVFFFPIAREPVRTSGSNGMSQVLLALISGRSSHCDRSILREGFV